MDEGPSNADEQRPNNGNAANAAAPNDDQIADIFKLDIDCFDETFDYLPIKDLISIGKTCKRLEKVAGYCYYQNYPYSQIASESGGLRVVTHNRIINIVTHFAPFIRAIAITGNDNLKYLITIKSKLRWLKQINIRRINITAAEIDCMKGILSKVEVLRIKDCQLNFHAINALCPKLHFLKIDNRCADYTWLHQKFLTLESFEFSTDVEDTGSIEAIMKFFELNPNVRKFAIRANYLWANKDRIKQASYIKLDELSVSFSRKKEVEVKELCELLNELYQRGVYKRLHCSFEATIYQDMVDELAMVNGLIKLSGDELEDDVTINALTSLEELSLANYAEITNIDDIAKNIINLKRIHLRVAAVGEIIPFIRRSVALKMMRVGHFLDDDRFTYKTNILDLRALNRERQQLPDAEKITLCVEEDVYLATKWAMKQTDFEFIRLKRLEVFQFNLEFAR